MDTEPFVFITDFIFEHDYETIQKFLNMYQCGYFTKVAKFNFMVSGGGLAVYFIKDLETICSYIKKFRKLKNFQ